MDDPALEDRLADGHLGTRPVGEEVHPGPEDLLAAGAVDRPLVEHLAVEAQQRARERLAQADRALHDGVEDRLHVGGRARDHAEDLAGRGLLLQRLGQVAVAPVELGEEAHVLDRDDGLVREGLEELDLAVREVAHLRPSDCDCPDRAALPDHRDRDDAAKGDDAGDRAEGEVGICVDIGDVGDDAVEDRPPRGATAIRRSGEGAAYGLRRFGGVTIAGHEVEPLAVVPKDLADGALAQAGPALSDRVEHGLGVGGRAGDDPQDLAGGGLLLEGLGQLAVAGLDLGEQADVLDGDHRLGREGLQEIDLLGGEGPRRLPGVNRDAADRDSLPQHGHREHAAQSGALHAGQCVGGVLPHVRDVDRSAGQDRSPVGGGERRLHRVRPAQGFAALRARVVEGLEVDQGAVVGEDAAGVGPAQAPRVARDGGEDRLDVGGAARDHAEDLARGGLLLEGLGQLAVAGLELPEQARVLDRDHRLIGERPQQRDLAIGEALRLGAQEGDDPDRQAFAKHRHRECAPERGGRGHVAERVVGVRAHVGDVGHTSVEDRPPRGGAPIGRAGPRAAHRRDAVATEAVVGDEVEQGLIEAEDEAELRFAQTRGGLGDRVEHRLDVGRGAGNDPEDLAGGSLLLE